MNRNMALTIAVLIAILCVYFREYKVVENTLWFIHTFIDSMGDALLNAIKAGMEI